MENKSLSGSVILGLSLLLGFFLLGFLIFKGLKTFSDKDRIVTVKGLAEMNISATLKMAKKMEMAFLSGMMDVCIMETIKIIKWMAMDRVIILLEF